MTEHRNRCVCHYSVKAPPPHINHYHVYNPAQFINTFRISQIFDFLSDFKFSSTTHKIRLFLSIRIIHISQGAIASSKNFTLPHAHTHNHQRASASVVTVRVLFLFFWTSFWAQVIPDRLKNPNNGH